MKLKNSYIFFRNPYIKEEKTQSQKSGGTIVIKNKKNLYWYIKSIFPQMERIDDSKNWYKRKYKVQYKCGKYVCDIELIMTNVVDMFYLDIVIKGKTENQIVKCFEEITDKINKSGFQEKYIDIISYDAVSEYYCNKVFPKLNTLERNLRKLLFNIYTVNFGTDYYSATITEELQAQIKEKINKDPGKNTSEYLRETYKVSGSQGIEIRRMKNFFYSLDYSDIQKILFIPHWNESDESAKNEFLEKNKDLSKVSDKELREAFSKYIPKSDWSRFFSDKITICDIEVLIKKIQIYRNRIAHLKFFYREDYAEFNKIMNRLNEAIVKAIEITEEKDFIKKNEEFLSKSLSDAFSTSWYALNKYTKLIEGRMYSAFEKLIPIIQKNMNYSKELDVYNKFCQMEEKRQEIIEGLNQSFFKIQEVLKDIHINREDEKDDEIEHKNEAEN